MLRFAVQAKHDTYASKINFENKYVKIVKMIFENKYIRENYKNDF